ncbi:hypothetical protein Nepgr_006155 [Nepenthes gracilis]|uniref:Uncharacterized protein n=1 Tax=Nepenthes gracilis TaxID=150966 RepID=A0AAD3S4N8_NEPGR|nr:hypothetical protein Nepgr_006155 [Nepenthes gracilis]
MATRQKFKFLAVQCAVAGSPTRSPTTSPVIHLRRRKTLRMFLSRGGGGGQRRFHRREESPDRRRIDDDKSTKGSEEQVSVRQKLKDLFISSPQLGENAKKIEVKEIQGLLPATEHAVDGVRDGGLAKLRGAGRTAGLHRPLSATLRQRLQRMAWRPVLIAIPEQSP